MLRDSSLATTNGWVTETEDIFHKKLLHKVMACIFTGLRTDTYTIQVCRHICLYILYKLVGIIYTSDWNKQQRSDVPVVGETSDSGTMMQRDVIVQ